MNRQLLKKEIHLQRTNRVVCAALVGMELLLYALAFDAKRELASHQMMRMGDLVQILHFAVILPLFLVVLPLMIGIAAAAPERQLGVMDWISSLPVSRHRQWLIKTGVALWLTAVSGIFFTLLDMLLLRKLGAMGFDRFFAPPLYPLAPSKIRDIYPAVYMILFTAIGAYAGTISGTNNRALLISALMIVLTVWFERVIDPCWMIVPLPITYPTYFLHPWAHYTHLLALAAVIAWWAGRTFRFELPRLRQYPVVLFAWFVIVNALGWWTLKMEFTEHDLVEKGTPQSAHVKPLVNSAQIWTHDFYRIPNSDAILTRFTTRNQLDRTKKDAGFLDNISDTGTPVFEINVRSGEIAQRINVSGPIAAIDPDGNWYAMDAPFYDGGTRALVHFPFAWNRDSWFVGGLLRLFIPEAIPDWRSNLPHPQILKSAGRYDYFQRKFGIWREIACDSKTRIAHVALVRQAELQPKPEVIESSLTKYSELDYDYCVSRDTQWYARYPYRNGSLSVMRSDHSTTHTLAAGNGQIFVASRFGVIPPGITVSEDLALGPISHVLNISPDGRWMAFIRQTRKNKEELLSNSTESVVEFGLLDLNSGTVAIVDRREVLAASNQDYFSMLPFAWSPRGTLAVVFADQVMLFKPDSATGEINARRIIEVKPIAEAETKLRERGIGTGFRNLAFWDETTLLYWNFQSLWRIDLAESSNGN